MRPRTAKKSQTKSAFLVVASNDFDADVPDLMDLDEAGDSQLDKILCRIPTEEAIDTEMEDNNDEKNKDDFKTDVPIRTIRREVF